MTKKEAICDWVAGLLIGIIPLLAHVLMHFVGRPDPGWNNNWSADILVISITNSGMSAITIFARLVTSSQVVSSFKAGMKIFWALTLICFCMASFLYGAAVSGPSGGYTTGISIAFLIFSAVCSYNFECAFAEHTRENVAS